MVRQAKMMIDDCHKKTKTKPTTKRKATIKQNKNDGRKQATHPHPPLHTRTYNHTMMTSTDESTNSTTSKTAGTSTTTTTTTTIVTVPPASSYDENRTNDDAEVGHKDLDLGDGGSSVTSSINDGSQQRLKWRWLQAAYHSIVTIIGTGILGFPYATMYLGFAGGSMMIIFATVGCFYTAHLLTDLQKPDQGTYTEVADSIMGQGFSNYGVRPFQLLNFFPTATVMILVGGTAMFTLDGLDGNQKLDETAWIAIVSWRHEMEHIL